MIVRGVKVQTFKTWIGVRVSRECDVQVGAKDLLMNERPSFHAQ